MLGDYEEPIDNEPRDEAGSSSSAAPRSVPGAPGVQREGNSYSAAPPASPATSTPQADSPRPNPPLPEALKNPSAAGNVLDQFGGGIQMPDNWQRSDSSTPASTAPAPAFGALQSGTNDAQAQRTGAGAGLYGTSGDPASQQPSGTRFLDLAAPNTMTAIRGAGGNIAEARRVGGLPAAVGAVVRNTMVPAVGFAHDVAAGAKQLFDPAANALKTAVTGDPTPIGSASSVRAQVPNPAPNFPPQAARSSVLDQFGGGVPAPKGFSDWQANATQAQRDTAADVYRDARHQQAPGGMRNASANATALYNAEQQVRGTGVTAQRGANGVMEFTGNGANALPQTYAPGVDLNAANASMARANEVRQQYLDSQAASDGGPRGGVIRDTSAAETNATLARWGHERAIQRAIDTGNPKVMEGVARLTGSTGERYATDAQIASRDRNDAADRAARYGADMARLGIDRERLQIDRQNAAAHYASQGIDMQRTLQQLNGDRQLTGLRERIINPKSAGDAALASRQLAAIQGKEQQNAQVIYNEELINPAQPADGTRRVPMILNRDGTATAVTPRTAPKALPNGVSRDAAIQAARRALQGGYDQAAVLARLGEYGLTAEDLRQ